MISRYLLLSTPILLAGCSADPVEREAAAPATVEANADPVPTTRANADAFATAELVDGQGASVGSATIMAVGEALSLSVSATGLAPGTHAIHLHAVGLCEGPKFTSAGDHLNPTGRQHGKDNPAGAHLGDLPNIVAAADGSASANVTLAGSRAETAQALLDSDGTAIVIHAAADDYRTDPSGNSGDRIACGVMRPAS